MKLRKKFYWAPPRKRSFLLIDIVQMLVCRRQRHRCHFPTSSQPNENRHTPHSEWCCCKRTLWQPFVCIFLQRLSNQPNTILNYNFLNCNRTKKLLWMEWNLGTASGSIAVAPFMPNPFDFRNEFSNANRKWTIFFTLQIKKFRRFVCERARLTAWLCGKCQVNFYLKKSNKTNPNKSNRFWKNDRFWVLCGRMCRWQSKWPMKMMIFVGFWNRNNQWLISLWIMPFDAIQWMNDQ